MASHLIAYVIQRPILVRLICYHCWITPTSHGLRETFDCVDTFFFLSVFSHAIVKYSKVHLLVSAVVRI